MTEYENRFTILNRKNKKECTGNYKIAIDIPFIIRKNYAKEFPLSIILLIPIIPYISE